MSSFLLEKYNKLCSPARVYLIITFIWITLNILLTGNLKDNITGPLAYSLIWVLILNLICKKSEKAAWAVFLLPIFLHILILVAVMCFLGSATAEIIFEDNDCPYCDGTGDCNCGK